MVRTGARNLISDVTGLRVGHAEDELVRTGTTVLVADQPFLAVADIRGGAPGSREIDVLNPINLVGRADAIILSGGSVYGLDAASGVVAALREMGRGYRLSLQSAPVPIVPAAILFDLTNGGDKSWGAHSPYYKLGQTALAAASEDFALGTTGAGLGARAGIYKGGLGSASAVTGEEFVVGALAAVNSLGSPLLPGTDVFWAFPFEQNGEYGGRRPNGVFDCDLELPADMKSAQPGENTTIAIVAIDAEVTAVELTRIAIMAGDGLARALRPAHTPFDGDIVFGVSTGMRAVGEPRARKLMALGNSAADCLSRAIARGVYEAKSLGEMTAYRDLFPTVTASL
jgi:L-aminopeptidase/D-esterase-like protein